VLKPKQLPGQSMDVGPRITIRDAQVFHMCGTAVARQYQRTSRAGRAAAAAGMVYDPDPGDSQLQSSNNNDRFPRLQVCPALLRLITGACTSQTPPPDSFQVPSTPWPELGFNKAMTLSVALPSCLLQKSSLASECLRGQSLTQLFVRSSRPLVRIERAYRVLDESWHGTHAYHTCPA
jgi:hypothetical protein